MSNVLPTKLSQYLVRLHMTYAKRGENDLRDVIASSRFYVREEAAYDNWNGGMSGHDVVFFLPLHELAKTDVEQQSDVASGVKDLLQKMGEAIEDEFFNNVSFERGSRWAKGCRSSPSSWGMSIRRASSRTFRRSGVKSTTRSRRRLISFR